MRMRPPSSPTSTGVSQATEEQYDAHRPLRTGDDLRQILVYRVPRHFNPAQTWGRIILRLPRRNPP
jgi:hypothetical protein